MIVSVTGLKLKNKWAWFHFWRLAIPSFRQAQKAKGNLFCETKTINGVQHTLTAWQSRKHLKHYVLSGAHRKAMGHFSKIATGATITFESEEMPTWQDAIGRWEQDAQWY